MLIDVEDSILVDSTVLLDVLIIFICISEIFSLLLRTWEWKQNFNNFNSLKQEKLFIIIIFVNHP